jgi:Na+/H+ antiporter NhaD/arsenite permease-like protein
MAPAFIISAAVLLIFTLILGRGGRRISGTSASTYAKALLFSSLALFIIDVACFLADLGAWVFVLLSIVSVLLMLFFRPKKLSKAFVITRVDFFLILSFVLIFLVINSASTLLPKLHPSGSIAMFFYALLSSQLISNVPATVLLEKSSLFLPLSWGVNIGGNGTLIASLANFIAYRQGKGLGIFRFMELSFAYMIAVAAIVALLLYI